MNNNIEKIDGLYKEHILSSATEGTQRVELYRDVGEAICDMEKYIQYGWRVHTCSIGSSFNCDKVLVVYEKV